MASTIPSLSHTVGKLPRLSVRNFEAASTRAQRFSHHNLQTRGYRLSAQKARFQSAKPATSSASSPQTSRTFSTTPYRPAKTIQQLKARNATGPFSWKSALLFVITGGAMIVYFRYEKARLERKRVAEMSKGVGKPKVGGPFVLKDLKGREFTEEDLKGKYSFV